MFNVINFLLDTGILVYALSHMHFRIYWYTIGDKMINVIHFLCGMGPFTIWKEVHPPRYAAIDWWQSEGPFRPYACPT